MPQALGVDIIEISGRNHLGRLVVKLLQVYGDYVMNSRGNQIGQILGEDATGVGFNGRGFW